MKQESPPIHLDVRAFAQSARASAGHDPLSNYERLMQETQGHGADRVVDWLALGEIRTDEAGAEQVWLHLEVDVLLPLICQRCLSPVDIKVAVNRSFRFVDSEEAAQAQDEDAQEDVLALSPDFNLLSLIEDEVLMELPVIARHEACLTEVKLVAADPGFDTALTEKRHPFAVLAKLQNDKPS